MDERSRRIEQRLEWPMLVVAMLVIPALVIEESDVGAPWDTLAAALNWAIWSAFAAELAIMLCVVPDRRRWLRDHPLEVAIVVLTPPFLPAAMQAARVFRLARLLRVLSLVRMTRRLFSTDGVRDAGVLAVMTVLVGGAAFAAVEDGRHEGAITSWDGVWWAITTVTTVGYGDLTPVTEGGRIIATVVMLTGIGFVAILTAAAAGRFLHGARRRRRRRARRRRGPPRRGAGAPRGDRAPRGPAVAPGGAPEGAAGVTCQRRRGARRTVTRSRLESAPWHSLVRRTRAR